MHITMPIVVSERLLLQGSVGPHWWLTKAVRKQKSITMCIITCYKEYEDEVVIIEKNTLVLAHMKWYVLLKMKTPTSLQHYFLPVTTILVWCPWCKHSWSLVGCACTESLVSCCRCSQVQPPRTPGLHTHLTAPTDIHYYTFMLGERADIRQTGQHWDSFNNTSFRMTGEDLRTHHQSRSRTTVTG